MAIRVSISPTPPGDLDRLLAQKPLAPHSLDRNWMDAMVAAYPFFHPTYLILEEDGQVRGVVPTVEKRWLGLREIISLPFGTYGGPVLAPEATPAGIEALAGEFLRLARSRRTFRFEMTVLDPPTLVGRVLESVLGSFSIPFHTFLIDLGAGKKALWDRYEGRARTSVRKSIKSGVAVATESGEDALDTLHLLYANQSEARDITWHYSREALRRVIAVLGDDVRIWVARKEGRALSGALAVYHPGREVIPWVTGSVPESRPVNAFPHLMHAIMEDAADRGFRTWNFGASAGNPSVQYFKTAFGGELRPVLRYFFEAAWVRNGRKLTQRFRNT